MTRDPPSKDRQTTPTAPEPSIPSTAVPTARPKARPAPTAATSAAGEVADFVERMRALAPQSATRGRLLFAMDATMSRQPTWDLALALQAEMFQAVKSIGGLDVQLVYFRGAGECRASKWVGDPEALARLMTTVSCAGGYTQIGKVLSHVRREATERRISAVVYVGDCMEEEIDTLCGQAGEIGLLGVPIFMFQEGSDPVATQAFQEIAKLTRGAWCRFDAGSASQLRDLLTAVAVYAAGGRAALKQLGQEPGNRQARHLLAQLT
jgi:hypothetical protein